MLQVEYKFYKKCLKYNFKYNFYTSLQFLNYFFKTIWTVCCPN